MIVCVVVFLKLDFHVLLISKRFNSDNFLHATYIETCKLEHVSCLVACYKLTPAATSRNSSRVPLVTCRRHQHVVTSVGWLLCGRMFASISYATKLSVPRKHSLQNADNRHKLGQLLNDCWLLLFFLQPSMLVLKQIMRRLSNFSTFLCDSRVNFLIRQITRFYVFSLFTLIDQQKCISLSNQMYQQESWVHFSVYYQH